jgi:hypothetical protein
MTPDMNNDPGVLLVVGLVACALVFWPEYRARIDAHFAARRAARAARAAAPRETDYRNRWH